MRKEEGGEWTVKVGKSNKVFDFKFESRGKDRVGGGNAPKTQVLQGRKKRKLERV